MSPGENITVVSRDLQTHAHPDIGRIKEVDGVSIDPVTGYLCICNSTNQAEKSWHFIPIGWKTHSIDCNHNKFNFERIY